MADGALFGVSKNNLDENKELLLYSPYLVVDGVNEKGFAISAMLLTKNYNTQYEDNKDLLPVSFVVRYLLDNADSVESAIKILKEHNLNFTKEIEAVGENLTLHWSILDVSGDKAVIEYVNSKMNVITTPLSVEYNEQTYEWGISYPNEEKPYLINTNFYLSQDTPKTLDEEGFWRYSTMQKALEANPAPRQG